MDTNRSQRWRDRRFRLVDDVELVDRRAYTVEPIAHAAARAFVARHHYLPTWPAAQLAVGLFGSQRSANAGLTGVAVFAVPATAAVIARHTGFAEAERGAVLARFILLDEIPQNGESFFLSRALRLLRREKPAIEAVVSYADPGAGHIGRCYAALSGAHRGVTRPRRVLRIGEATISGRTLSKVRGDERGAAGAVDRMVAAGMPRPAVLEGGAAWLNRLIEERLLLPHVQAGLFAYCFELTREARRRGRALPRRPYPKLVPGPDPQIAFALG